jgi:uncharacterized protein (DUF1697 family)
MPRYLALLGSINVGGNRLTMADLRAAFEAEGFTNVETVVASGNVLFDHPERPEAGLEEKLSQMLRRRFGFNWSAPAQLWRLRLLKIRLQRTVRRISFTPYFSMVRLIRTALRGSSLTALAPNASP